MIERRPYDTLRGSERSWLRAKHHFLFEGAEDTWGALFIWNDDEIAPAGGFPAHPHANVEIISYVQRGAVTHQDSLGNSGRTAAGDVQVMSAGAGIRHSEYNLESEPTQLFQIWIKPRRSKAARPPGAPSRSPNKIGPDVWSSWRAATTMTPTPCRSAPKPR